MKVTFKTLDGRTMSKEFASVDEFVTLQNREIPAIDDSAKVLEVVILDKLKNLVEMLLICISNLVNKNLKS